MPLEVETPDSLSWPFLPLAGIDTPLATLIVTERQEVLLPQHIYLLISDSAFGANMGDVKCTIYDVPDYI